MRRLLASTLHASRRSAQRSARRFACRASLALAAFAAGTSSSSGAQTPSESAGAAAPACERIPTALVLSGGGAKGLAHIGVIRVLDSLGIRPDLVVGTSMGALVGALYASGYSGGEIEAFVHSLPLTGLLGTYAPRAPEALGGLQPLVLWEQGERGFVLQSASVREAEVNALLNVAMLRGNLLARGDFDSLAIPFRAVAVDLRDRSAVVLRGGDLARAVRASIAIPLIFPPEQVGGRWLADGGLVANLPVATARAAGARRVIVSDVTDDVRARADSVDFASPSGAVSRLLDFLFDQPRDSLGPADLFVRPDVGGFTALDFSARRADALIARGVRAADSTIAPAARCLPRADASPAPRGSAGSLPLTVRKVEVAGTPLATPIAAKDLAERLGLIEGEPLDPARLRERLRALGESETYRAVWLRPRRAGAGAVSFDLAVRRTPRRVAGAGLAYDNELGGKLWLGLVDRELLGRDVEGAGALFLGELRRELAGGLRVNSAFGRRIATPTLTARIAEEEVRQFEADGDELSALEVSEAIGFAGVERSLGGGWLAALGGEGRIWRPAGGSTLEAGGPLARLTRNHPGNGERLFEAEGVVTGRYRRVTLDAIATAKLGALHLRPRIRIGWGEELPVQLGLPLGGNDGFPGLHIGERRGQREAMGSLLATYPVFGPIVLRLEGAAGRSAAEGPLLDEHGWLTGVRIGLGVDTPVGPVRVEYGVASGGREALFVRLGRWF